MIWGKPKTGKSQLVYHAAVKASHVYHKTDVYFFDCNFGLNINRIVEICEAREEFCGETKNILGRIKTINIESTEQLS
jgi:hypothetical protein